MFCTIVPIHSYYISNEYTWYTSNNAFYYNKSEQSGQNNNTKYIYNLFLIYSFLCYVLFSLKC